MELYLSSNLDLSIIIVNYNNPNLIDSCIQSIDKYLYDINKEILIVDNNSEIECLSRYRASSTVIKTIYLPVNMGFGYANNVGAINASGDVFLLLNSDIEFLDNTFKEMLSQFKALNFSEIWAPRLVWPDGNFQNSYSKDISLLSFILNYTSIGIFFRCTRLFNEHKYCNEELTQLAEVDVMYATAWLIRKIDYEKLGGFSNRYFMYFEDVDFCDRLRKKLSGKIRYYPGVTLLHRAQGSSLGRRTNFQYFKSKYIYALYKYGFLIILIAPIDIFFQLIYKDVIAMKSCLITFFHKIYSRNE